jgi:hypothetical protein
MYNLENVPEYANHYEFIVVRFVDGAYWFWGAYADGFKAEQVALEVDGVIVHNVKIQGYKP